MSGIIWWRAGIESVRKRGLFRTSVPETGFVPGHLVLSGSGRASASLRPDGEKLVLTRHGARCFSVSAGAWRQTWGIPDSCKAARENYPP